MKVQLLFALVMLTSGCITLIRSGGQYIANLTGSNGFISGDMVTKHKVTIHSTLDAGVVHVIDYPWNDHLYSSSKFENGFTTIEDKYNGVSIDPGTKVSVIETAYIEQRVASSGSVGPAYIMTKAKVYNVASGEDVLVFYINDYDVTENHNGIVRQSPWEDWDGRPAQRHCTNLVASSEMKQIEDISKWYLSDRFFTGQGAHGHTQSNE